MLKIYMTQPSVTSPSLQPLESGVSPCEYQCQDTGSCTVRYTGPARSGQTKGSCFPRSFGAACSGAPVECQDCNRVLQCSEAGAIYSPNIQQPVNQPQVFQGPFINPHLTLAQAYAQHARAQVVYTQAQEEYAEAQAQFNLLFRIFTNTRLPSN